MRMDLLVFHGRENYTLKLAYIIKDSNKSVAKTLEIITTKEGFEDFYDILNIYTSSLLQILHDDSGDRFKLYQIEERIMNHDIGQQLERLFVSCKDDGVPIEKILHRLEREFSFVITNKASEQQEL